VADSQLTQTSGQTAGGAKGVAATLPARYAFALYALADEQGQLDAVAADLRALKAAIEGSAELARWLRNPVATAKQQQAAFAPAIAGCSDLVQRFVKLVVKNRRLFALPRIIDAYLAELARRRGQVTAEVVSAHPLDAAQEAELLAALRRIEGEKVVIEKKVDPSLLGGLVVRVGSRLFDSSLRTKLARLHVAMKGSA